MAAGLFCAALLPVVLLSGENPVPEPSNGRLVLLARTVVAHTGGQGPMA